MKNKHTPLLSRKKREATRLKAAKLFKKNIPQAEIGRRMKVTPAAVNYWHIAWKQGGNKALKSKGQPGFPSKLTSDKRMVFKKAILKGPLEYGYETLSIWCAPSFSRSHFAAADPSERTKSRRFPLHSHAF